VSNETLNKLRNDVRERPDDVEAWYELAAAALDQGALDEAREAMTRVLERAPDHLGAHRVLAVIEGELGRNRAAIDLWRRVVALSGGDDVEALTRLVPVLALNREASDLGRLVSEEARAIRRDAHRSLVESIERRSQQVWIPVTVAALVPGVLFLIVPFMEALRLYSQS